MQREQRKRRGGVTAQRLLSSFLKDHSGGRGVGPRGTWHGMTAEACFSQQTRTDSAGPEEPCPPGAAPTCPEQEPAWLPGDVSLWDTEQFPRLSCETAPNICPSLTGAAFQSWKDLRAGAHVLHLPMAWRVALALSPLRSSPAPLLLCPEDSWA